MHPEATPETREDVATLIVEAFEAGHEMPPYERLVEIDKGLRDEIGRLTAHAQRLADKADHRSRQWYALVNAVDRAEDAMRFPLSTTPLAGAVHVAELAHRVQELREAGGITP
ncbi:DUF6415 family natural product biosynthesis protein [Streptomyces sp. NPDC006527]|jgi:hypothetical protein|uniref:DUF6415 family natural product biosynthesis protein n=1 Tax=Streptomyces sp. NPDC006527 TaxID=3364749 RepID=UPI0036B5F633